MIGKKLTVLFILAILFLSACCCSKEEVKPEPIKFGVLRIEDNLPFFIAEKEKLFDLKGIAVELVYFNSARARDIALEANEIQGALGDLVAAGLLRNGGTSLKIIALGLGASPAEGRFAILSAPESGITSPQQLQGVPIAISNNTIIHYLVESMLAEVNLPPNKIQTQNIPDLKVRLDCLLEGKSVKAALLPDPLATFAKQAGAHIIVDDTFLKTNLSQTVIFFREDALESYPSQIKALLLCFEEGANLLLHNTDDYTDLIFDKARIPKDLETVYQPPSFSPLQLPSRDMIERVMKWMLKKDLILNPLTYEILVNPHFLPQR